MDLNKLLKTQWDRTAGVAFSALGALFLLVGWIGVSGTAFLAEQAPYILSGGIGGVFFLGLGATLWISADLRDEWRKLDRIELALRDGTLRWVEGDTGRPVSAVSSDADFLGSTADFSRPLVTSSNGAAAYREVEVLEPVTQAAATAAPVKTSTRAGSKAATTAAGKTATSRRVAAPRATGKASGAARGA